MEESGTKPHIPFGFKHFALFSLKPSVYERVYLSLNHWKQLRVPIILPTPVVICFQISIFEPLETTEYMLQTNYQLVTHIFRN